MSWTNQPTAAHTHLGSALLIADDILSFAKDTKGKPTKQERALFAAAVVFTYGVWESFVEQLAIELVTHLSREIAPEKVPQHVREGLEKKSAWELSIAPGWRWLWIDEVTTHAIGGKDKKYGMNNANASQVKELIKRAGPVDPFKGVPAALVPKHLVKGTTVEKGVAACVNENEIFGLRV